MSAQTIKKPKSSPQHYVINASSKTLQADRFFKHYQLSATAETEVTSTLETVEASTTIPKRHGEPRAVGNGMFASNQLRVSRDASPSWFLRDAAPATLLYQRATITIMNNHHRPISPSSPLTAAAAAATPADNDDWDNKTSSAASFSSSSTASSMSDVEQITEKLSALSTGHVCRSEPPEKLYHSNF
ncbi:hypothetical protein HDU88_007957 [Geranomyces variabilis]|nr:hypothetical protein HDU88_007957 [Geranomyces variabilis]